jgi:hypothetical protein
MWSASQYQGESSICANLQIGAASDGLFLGSPNQTGIAHAVWGPALLAELFCDFTHPAPPECIPRRNASFQYTSRT